VTRRPSITLPLELRTRLVRTVREIFPRKAFGYLISDVDEWTPTDFVMFSDNIRNQNGWRDEFESYGRYFVEHSDAGFVATADESWRVQKEIWARDMFEIGVFHSHQRHPANFSLIDYEMHVLRFETLWHMIISMRNPKLPQVRAFAVSSKGVCEFEVKTRPHDVHPLVEVVP
jgi:proteasome lid subunit RPN8/RPN11